MKKARNKYSREFKMEAIALSNQPGVSITQVARDLGLPEGRLYQWRNRYENNGAGAFPGKGNLTAEAVGNASAIRRVVIAACWRFWVFEEISAIISMPQPRPSFYP